jgi:predicted ATPase
LLIQDLLAEQDKRLNLFLIVSYRDSEVDSLSPLAGIMGYFRSDKLIHGAVLLLEELTFQDIGSLLADALRSTQTAVEDLARVLLEKCRGFPQTIEDFLKYLIQLGLVYYEKRTSQSLAGESDGIHKSVARSNESTSDGWRWNIAQIRQCEVSSNADTIFTVNIIPNLTGSDFQLLKAAACVGPAFDLETLLALLPSGPKIVCQGLKNAIESGCILPNGDSSRLLDVYSEESDHNTSMMTDSVISFKVRY